MKSSKQSTGGATAPQLEEVYWFYKLDTHTLLTFIPSGTKFFTAIHLCISFLGIPVDEATLCLFAFTWEETNNSPG